jgi:hypothetical protein
MYMQAICLAFAERDRVAHDSSSGCAYGKDRIKKLFLAALATVGAAGAAQANDVVIYTWTTTSQGFGSHVDQPTSASFEVPLASVQAGKILYSDISNIQLVYPGLTLTSFTQTSIGLDNAAYVDPLTGAPIFHGLDQGLGVVGYQGGLFSDSFLSITFDAVAYTQGGQPLSAVADQFNALNNGAPYAGYPTAGYWTAAIVIPTPTVPEPASWAMMVGGFGLIGGALRARRKTAVGFG